MSVQNNVVRMFDGNLHNEYDQTKKTLKKGSCPMTVRLMIEAAHTQAVQGTDNEQTKSIRVKNFMGCTFGAIATIATRIVRIAAYSLFFVPRMIYLAGKASRYNLNQHNANQDMVNARNELVAAKAAARKQNGSAKNNHTVQKIKAAIKTSPAVPNMVENRVSEHARDRQKITNEFVDLKNTFKSIGILFVNIFAPSCFQGTINEMKQEYITRIQDEAEDDVYVNAKMKLQVERKREIVNAERSGNKKDDVVLPKDAIALPKLRRGPVSRLVV